VLDANERAMAEKGGSVEKKMASNNLEFEESVRIESAKAGNTTFISKYISNAFILR
jgi:hypothetical protein